MDIIQINEAAKLLDVSHAAVQYAVKNGRLHAVMGGIDGRRIKGILANEVYALVALKNKNLAKTRQEGVKNDNSEQ